MRTTLTILSITLAIVVPASALSKDASYRIVGTGQTKCYDDRREIAYPREGQPFYGQDAQFKSREPSYKNNGDGTVTDLNTELMWVRARGTKVTFAEATAGAAKCRIGSHTDWRMPTIKELYSLINFNGGFHMSAAKSTPYLDTKHFEFAYGDEAKRERAIDCQDWSATEYVSTTMNGNATVFGVNFADGRIKGYPKSRPHPHGGASNKLFVRYVRDNPNYGKNDFHDNGDGTITDRATGLVWSKADSGRRMNWEDALARVQARNSEKYLGYADWRLPNAKELQSIVDYARAPAVTHSPAIDPVFETTRLGDGEYPFFWTSTTHLDGPPDRQGAAAVYVAFGRALGWMQSPPRTGDHRLLDVHGAGAQRSDPKTGDPADYPHGRGPQGDVIRIHNYVRCVRGGGVVLRDAGLALEPAPDRRPPSTPGRASGGEGRRRPDDSQTAERTKRFMNRYDRDGDGQVSRQEFDGPSRRFRHLDRNQDGVIDGEETAGLPDRRRPGGEEGPEEPPSRRRRQQASLEVITVGTGSPLYNPNRGGPCALIRNGSQHVLVDMGEGTSRHLSEAQIALGSMAAFCFTHHHRDHNDDAMTILPRAWLRGIAVPVIGPTGTRQLCDFLWNFYEEDLQYRAGNRGGSAAALARPEVIELPQAEPLTIAGMKVTTAQVSHTITTFAYRFEAAGKAIVVSGDLTYSESLIELAQDADILVMDSGGVVYTETRDGRPRMDGRRRKDDGGSGREGGGERPGGTPGRRTQVAHASLEEVARMAAAARVKKLVLTHFRPGTVNEEETRRRMNEIYSGEILFGEDMKIYR